MQITKLIVSIVGASAAVGGLIYTIIAAEKATQESVESLQVDVAALQDVVQDMAVSPDTVLREHVPSALEIEFEGQTIGAIEGLRIQPAADNPSRHLVQLTASFPGFTGTLDRILREQGNFGSCPSRLYWSGGSSVRRDGASLALSSRVRYEQWVCSSFWGKTRIFRDTKTVAWRISVESSPLDELLLVAEVDNVRSLQDDLERLLGVRVRDEIKIPLPAYCGSCECDKIVDILGPAVESTRFSRTSGGGMRIEVKFSVASDLTGALGCLSSAGGSR